MNHIKKPLYVAMFATLLFTMTGCERFGRDAKPVPQKPAKLVKIADEVSVLTKVQQVSLPQSGGRIKGVKFNKKDVADLQVAQFRGSLVAASRAGTVTRFSEQGQLWSVGVGEVISSGVATNEEIVVVGTRSGKIIAIDGDTGVVSWQRELSSSSLAPALISGNQVMVSTNDGMIYALDVATGKSVWQFSTQSPDVSVRGMATPIALDGRTALFGASDGRIYAIDSMTGTPLWNRRVGRAVGGSQVHRMSDVDGTPLVVGSYLFVPSYSGQLAGFDMSSGRTMFVSEVASTKSPAWLDGNVVVSSTTGEVVAFDVMSGQKAWQNDELKYRKLTNPVNIGKYVAVGDLEGVIHVLDNEGNIVSRTQTKGALTSLSVMGGHLYTQSSEGVLTAWRIH